MFCLWVSAHAGTFVVWKNCARLLGILEAQSIKPHARRSRTALACVCGLISITVFVTGTNRFEIKRHG